MYITHTGDINESQGRFYVWKGAQLWTLRGRETGTEKVRLGRVLGNDSIRNYQQKYSPQYPPLLLMLRYKFLSKTGILIIRKIFAETRRRSGVGARRKSESSPQNSEEGEQQGNGFSASEDADQDTSV